MTCPRGTDAEKVYSRARPESREGRKFRGLGSKMRRSADSEFPERNGITWPETPSVHLHRISIQTSCERRILEQQDQNSSVLVRIMEVNSADRRIQIHPPKSRRVLNREMRYSRTLEVRVRVFQCTEKYVYSSDRTGSQKVQGSARAAPSLNPPAEEPESSESENENREMRGRPEVST